MWENEKGVAGSLSHASTTRILFFLLGLATFLYFLSLEAHWASIMK
jgi:hypothetical protein